MAAMSVNSNLNSQVLKVVKMLWCHLSLLSSFQNPSASPVGSTFKTYPETRLYLLSSHSHYLRQHHASSRGQCLTSEVFLTFVLDFPLYGKCHLWKCEIMSQPCSKLYNVYSSPCSHCLHFHLVFYPFPFPSRKLKYKSHYVGLQA